MVYSFLLAVSLAGCGKKNFSATCSLTLVSPGGREVKESSHLLYRVRNARIYLRAQYLFSAPCQLSQLAAASGVEVHRELVRMRAQPRLTDLAIHLVIDPGLDQVGREDVALEQELVV